MPDTITIKQLLEAGAHFGHQASGWHPRMKKKDRSLARYHDFEDYRKKTKLFIPFVF